MRAKRFLFYWLPVIIYAIGIFVASSIPEPALPPLFPHADKIYHFVEYAIFSFLLIRALNSSEARLKGYNLRMLAIFLSFIYAVSDELHQYFVPGRSMQAWDLLSDGLGAYVGQWFFRVRSSRQVSDTSASSTSVNNRSV